MPRFLGGGFGFVFFFFFFFFSFLFFFFLFRVVRSLGSRLVVALVEVALINSTLVEPDCTWLFLSWRKLRSIPMSPTSEWTVINLWINAETPILPEVLDLTPNSEGLHLWYDSSKCFHNIIEGRYFPRGRFPEEEQSHFFSWILNLPGSNMPIAKIQVGDLAIGGHGNGEVYALFQLFVHIHSYIR